MSIRRFPPPEGWEWTPPTPLPPEQQDDPPAGSMSGGFSGTDYRPAELRPFDPRPRHDGVYFNVNSAEGRLE